MNLKLKRLHERATVPAKANAHDAGLDFTAVEEEFDPVTGSITYKLGWAVEIPENHVGLLFARSSIVKKDLILSNSVGVIDSGYRGELMAKFKGLIPTRAKKYVVGDKVVQLVIIPIPSVELEIVDELTNSERGTGGYGSSGV